MPTVTTMLWLAWWGAAALALGIVATTRTRRIRLDPADRTPRGWPAAYRAPAALMAVASASVIVPYLGGTAAGLGTSITTHALSGLCAAWLVLAAAVLGVCYLTGDPSRGRRRCPRCWYDMSGAAAALICPECGKAAASEEGLLRTRRRRGLLVWGAALLLAAGPAWMAADVRDGTWTRRVPTVALVWWFPHMPQAGGPLLDELSDRIAARGAMERMPRWQRQWLVRQSIRAIGADVHANRETAALHTLAALEEDAYPAIPDLVQAFIDPKNCGQRISSARALAHLNRFAPELLPSLLRELKNPAPAVQRRVLELVSAIAAATPEQLPPPPELIAYASEEADPALRAAAMYCIPAFRYDDAVRALVIEWLTDEDPRVRTWSVQMLSTSEPTTVHSIAARIGALRDTAPLVRGAAAMMVARHGPHTADLRERILQIVAEPGGGAVLHALVNSHASREYKLEVIGAALDRPRTVRFALFALSDWAYGRTALRPRLERLHQEAMDAGDLDHAAYLERLIQQ